MKKKKYPMVNLGTASILTIFIILALVTFATLSYISARKDAGYTNQAVTSSQQYQDAVNQAYEKIAEIDASLFESYQSGNFESQLDTDYSFSIPISDASELQVVLTPCLPSENEGGLYRITTFQEVRTKQWKNDSTLQLLQ